MINSETKKLFVSVGSRFPMCRLLDSVEEVLSTDDTLSALAQIGESEFQSNHMQVVKWLDDTGFEQAVRHCDVFVSHAGMGNILLAARCNKPIVIMPRRFSFAEHINDHQTSTANAFINRPFVTVVNDTQELREAISRSQPIEPESSTSEGRSKLIQAIKQFIDHGQL